jgi:AcrR family transcriptional regulator
LTRLTRAEKQEATRERLLAAAERTFTSQGFHDTSVDQIADEAGFSKGAVYSQFESKDELFLCVMERRFDSRALGIEGTIDPREAVTDQATAAGDAFLEMFNADPRWSLLLMEYSAHAARHPEIRERFAARNRHIRAEMAALIDTHLGRLGLTSPMPTDELATLLFSLGQGILMEKLVDGDAVPDTIFGSALGLLFAGLTSGQKPQAKRAHA